MYIILPILLGLIGIGLLVLLNKEIIYEEVTSFIAITFAALFIISSIGFGINAGIYLIVNHNMEAYHTQKIETRDSYIALLNKYDTLTAQDKTASDSYFTLYEKIIDFNQEVRMAQNNKERAFWTEGLLYDPSYLNIDIIPIEEP